jgi:hypothetical protein
LRASKDDDFRSPPFEAPPRSGAPQGEGCYWMGGVHQDSWRGKRVLPNLPSPLRKQELGDFVYVSKEIEAALVKVHWCSYR